VSAPTEAGSAAASAVESSGATHPRAGITFWIGVVIGGGVMAFGLRGLLDQVDTTSAAAIARWVIGADLVHDLLLAPIAILVGWAAGRAVPDRFRFPVQAALVATGVVLLIAWAPLRGYGRAVVPDNPSVQPLNYATAVVTILVLVWVAAGVAIAARLARDLTARPR